MKYLASYPESLKAQVLKLLEQGRLGETLLAKYPHGHGVRTDKALYDYVSRVQGNKLKAKREIRVASLFKEVPVEFLRMITVHELAHIKEKAHDKAFYKLCTHMEPQYHQYEFDLRVYLTHMDEVGKLEWASKPGS